MNYVIHVALLISLCWAFYHWFLQQETFYRLNRWVLLGGLAACFLLPLIAVPPAWSLRSGTESTLVAESAFRLTLTESRPAQAKSEPSRKQAIPAPPPQPVSLAERTTRFFSGIAWYKLATRLYFLGFLVFSIHLIFQLAVLFYRIARQPGYRTADFRIIELSGDRAPYSFWNNIFINPAAYDSETFDHIVRHECIHVRQRHSIDILLAEVVLAIQWFNPFAWWYRAAIENNLEFLTDAEMISQGTDRRDYQLNLVKVSVPDMPQGLTANYNQKFLKKRIDMMNAKHSSPRSGWKYIALLALLFFSVLQLNAIQKPVPLSELPHVPVAVYPPGVGAIDAIADNYADESKTKPTQRVSSEAERPVIQSNETEAIPSRITATTLSGYQAQWRTEQQSWTAEIVGDEVCFQFITNEENNRGNHYWSRSACFARSRLGTLPTGSIGTFSVTREAGKMEFRGLFDGNEGVGTFSFTPDAGFISELKKEDITGLDKEDLIHLFFANTTLAFVRDLRARGYRPDGDTLKKLAIFGLDQPTLTTRLTNLEKAGFERPSLDRLIKLTIHGVTDEYIEELAQMGFSDLTLEEITKAKIHGVDTDFGKDMKAAGFTDLTLGDLQKMSIHGVTSAYVASLRDAGYRNLDVSDVVGAKIHGVDSDMIATIREFGFPTDDLDRVKKFAIHGVSRSDIKGWRDMGYSDMDMDDFVHARIHGVTPEYAKSFAKVGFEKIPYDTLQRMKIHGLTADYIERNKQDGKDIDHYIKLKIHGLGR